MNFTEKKLIGIKNEEFNEFNKMIILTFHRFKEHFYFTKMTYSSQVSS